MTGLYYCIFTAHKKINVADIKLLHDLQSWQVVIHKQQRPPFQSADKLKEQDWFRHVLGTMPIHKV